MTSRSKSASGGPLRLGAGELWAIGAALSYSLINVYTGLTVRGQGINYFMGVALRATPAFLLALTLALGRLLRRRHGQETAISRVGGRLILVLFASGLCTLVIGNPLLFAALRVGGILVATPISGTNVLWGAVFAALLLHELLNLRMAQGMLLSTAGVLVLTLGNTTQATLAPGWWMAVPYAAGTAVSWAVGWLLSAYALPRGVGCFHALATTSGTALLCLNVYVLLSGQISSCVTIPSAQKGSKNLLGSRSMGWKCILGVFFLVYMIGFIAINLQLFM